ncbi:ADP-ribosylglycohydrolase family protein [Marinicella meishanensis]|uniref:ADP-ribosylglycohydrolase family protein n=1 Tax=Marinicella meishanensis TaxID=2873263 RepID=UPI001CBE676F|nr:ADP-ribosylglycohydrolase family protein [Marinicella sp. NBU2979]
MSPAHQQSANQTHWTLLAIRHAMVADAHAMPVHWYYRKADIERAFPDGLDGLYAAPAQHPSAIMSLHSKQHGGRHRLGAQQADVVGAVILHDKAEFWDRPGVHYHQGLQAGDNTLNAHTVLWLLQAMVDRGGSYQESAFLQHYVNKMTAQPPQHPDTYAESYHRGFFANWASGQSAAACAAVTHDTPSVGGLVRIGPLALLLLHQGMAVADVKTVVARHLDLTHPDAALKKVCFQYVDLISGLLAAADPAAAERLLQQHLLTAAGRHFKRKPVAQWSDAAVLGGLYSTACYIRDAWPSVLYLANKYHHDLRQALQVNAQLGGDNVHRGAVLALLITLINPQPLDDWYAQLTLAAELDACLAALGLLS